MSKISAQGVKLQIDDGVGVFTDIAQLDSISGPTLTQETIDVTTHDSADNFREFVGGLKDGGEITLGIVFDPVNTNHKQLRTDLTSQVVQNFKLIFPDPATTTWSFSALVTAYAPDEPQGDKLMANITLKLSGSPTLA